MGIYILIVNSALPSGIAKKCRLQAEILRNQALLNVMDCELFYEIDEKEIADVSLLPSVPKVEYDTYMEAYYRGLTQNLGKNYKGSLRVCRSWRGCCRIMIIT